MIRPLRRAHERLMLLLALLVPAVLAAACLLRPAFPIQMAWPFR